MIRKLICNDHEGPFLRKNFEVEKIFYSIASISTKNIQMVVSIIREDFSSISFSHAFNTSLKAIKTAGIQFYTQKNTFEGSDVCPLAISFLKIMMSHFCFQKIKFACSISPNERKKGARRVQTVEKEEKSIIVFNRV